MFPLLIMIVTCFNSLLLFVFWCLECINKRCFLDDCIFQSCVVYFVLYEIWINFVFEVTWFLQNKCAISFPQKSPSKKTLSNWFSRISCVHTCEKNKMRVGAELWMGSNERKIAGGTHNSSENRNRRTRQADKQITVSDCSCLIFICKKIQELKVNDSCLMWMGTVLPVSLNVELSFEDSVFEGIYLGMNETVIGYSKLLL